MDLTSDQILDGLAQGHVGQRLLQLLCNEGAHHVGRCDWYVWDLCCWPRARCRRGSSCGSCWRGP